jgi:hypothetical protein
MPRRAMAEPLGNLLKKTLKRKLSARKDIKRKLKTRSSSGAVQRLKETAGKLA